MRAVPNEKVELRVSDEPEHDENAAGDAVQPLAPTPDFTSNPIPSAPNIFALRMDYMKGAGALAASLTFFAGAVFAGMYVSLPWMWLYGEQGFSFSPGMVPAVFFIYLVAFEIQAVYYSARPPKPETRHALDVSPEAAFELCLHHIPTSCIVRIEETQREIEFRVTTKHTVLFRIDAVEDPSKSSIFISHSFVPDKLVLFWQADAQALLVAPRLAGCFALNKILKQIDSAAENYTGIAFGASSHSPVSVTFTPKNQSRWVTAAGAAASVMACWLALTMCTFDKMIYCLSKHSPLHALALCNARLAMAPTSDAWDSRGGVFMRLGDGAAAEADFRKGDHDEYGKISSAMVLQNRIADAMGVVADAESKFTRDSLTPKLLKSRLAWCAAHRSWLESLLGDYEMAVKDADRAIQLSPKYVFAYNARGYAKHSMGDNEAAIADYSTSFAISKNRTALQLRAKALKDLNRIDQYTEDRATAHAMGFRRTDLAIPAGYDDFGDPSAPGLPQ